jgi:adenylate cyclase
MERRLAAILLTDMVGYSRLMGLDEEGTIARQKAHREDIFDPKITAHGGRIVKSTGDGVLVEFPSVVDAVKCAVEVQQAMAVSEADVPEERRIHYRIGINLGDIVIDGDDILGDGVNVAARLESLAKPGGICISGTVHDHLAGKTDVAFEDAGEQTVKNVPRPVRVWHWQTDAAQQARPALALPGKPSMFVGAGFTLVVLIAGIAWWNLWEPGVRPSSRDQQAVTPKPDKPVIAVLPFDNMSRDAQQDYFSDGITADLITDLSRISGLLVIARNSTFTYKGTPTRVQQVARELGASHVLEGSVRKAGNRIRVSAQLIDGRTGYHLWADKYDRDLREVFALQDGVTQKIIAALSVKLRLNEKQRLSRSPQAHPEAYDMLLRGLEQYRQFTRESIDESRRYFKRAIALDPTFARAHAGLALSYSQAAQLGLSDDPKASMRQALEIAQHALQLDDTVREVYFVLANAYRANKRHSEALAASRHAIALDPNYADGYAQLAANLNYAGSPRDGLAAIKKAMKLNPRHPYFYVLILGQSFYLLGQYEKAVKQFERVKKSNPHFTQVHKMLAATYVALGRTDDAEWAATELETLIPNFSLKGEASSAPFKDEALLHLYIERLRKAGLK